MIGRTFDGRYEVLSKLGSGGMAEVYLAHDAHLDRQVALKVLSSRYAEDEQFVERFRREASNAAGLNHPNIVQIYDRGEAEGTYYIAMEYLDGRSLKEIIKRYGPLGPKHVASISRQILEALRFAHRKGIVHRDIKPQNMLVDDEGRVKVTDFGIARAATASRMTDTGSIVGTAQYLSPEQAQGTAVGPSSDLYSMGIVMYEMVTAQLPFDGDNPVTIAMKQVHEPPAPPTQINADIPENLERVILRSLAKDPADRYADADAFLEDLQRVEQGETVAPPPVFADEAETRVLGADDLPTRVLTSETMVRPRPAAPYPSGPPYEEAREEERGSRFWPWLLVVLFLVVLGVAAFALFQLLGGEEEELIEVPPLTGLTLEEATQEITDAGFELGNVDEEESQLLEGTVIGQEPDVGSLAPTGSEIDLVLSLGEQTVEVPPLEGLSADEAGTALGLAGLEISIEQEASADVEEGLVVRSEPASGESVPVGSTVVVFVSIGPEIETVAVPSVIGLTATTAAARLGQAGLEVEVNREPSDAPEREVIRQVPAAGEQIEQGQTVTIVVSSGPAQVRVTDVTGTSEEEARNLLRDQGLVVQARSVTAEASAGTVVDQNPAGGTNVPAGSTVVISVSTGPPPTTSTTATTAPVATTTTGG